MRVAHSTRLQAAYPTRRVSLFLKFSGLLYRAELTHLKDVILWQPSRWDACCGRFVLQSLFVPILYPSSSKVVNNSGIHGQLLEEENAVTYLTVIVVDFYNPPSFQANMKSSSGILNWQRNWGKVGPLHPLCLWMGGMQGYLGCRHGPSGHCWPKNLISCAWCTCEQKIESMWTTSLKEP